MKLDEMQALFALAKIEILNQWEVANQYWPEAYVQLRNDNPWWVVKTKYGLVLIGMRKKVLSIDWSDTPVRKIVTTDDVTKSETMVHAWDRLDAIRYLTALKEGMDELIPQRLSKLTERDENVIKDILKIMVKEPALTAILASNQGMNVEDLDEWLDGVFIKLGNGRVTFATNG